MASGDVLSRFFPLENMPPASNGARGTRRNSTPYLNFSDSSDEYAYFQDILSDKYSGGGLTVLIVFSASSATSGNVDWEAAFERHVIDSSDVDVDSFAAAQTVIKTTSTTNGHTVEASIAFTDGAQIDSLAVGERFRLRIMRDASGGTMVGDAEILMVVVEET